MDKCAFEMTEQFRNTVYHAVEKNIFDQFSRENNFKISLSTDLSTLYHTIFWLYHQFKSYKQFYSAFQTHNGFEIFQKCKESFAPNCACFAIMLNDILISMGYKSKAIWCLSSDPVDEECHALNHVWIDEINQWVVADPSSRSIICDEFGNPLHLLSMREYIYDGKFVYPHRNRSIRQSNAFIEEYNKYMKKNMFQFLTHIEQGLHYPLNKNAVLIHPIGYTALHKNEWERTSDISYIQ